jgi:hypothetical protein
MTMPVVPDRDRDAAINDVLVSIALEETALAHLINAEAEKVQWSVGLLETEPAEALDVEQVIEVQESVADVLRHAIKFQMLLQFKLEDILDAIEDEDDEDDDDDDGNGDNGENGENGENG